MVHAAWVPFQQWLADHSVDIAQATTPHLISMPTRQWRDADYRRANLPQSIVMDDRPSAIDAFALAGGQTKVFPGVSGQEPDAAAARADARKIAAAMHGLHRVAPDGGSYSSEMSYFEENWREAAWGPHYQSLLATKRKYDPDGVFTGHHQVGSEFWSADGFTRIA